MTDDKRPREFCLKGSKLFETTNGAWTKVIEAVEPDEFKLVERSAFDALAKENAALKHELKMCAARAQENAQLNTELLNTKELSSKLVEENAALKAEVERLQIYKQGNILDFAQINSELRDQLTREREVTLGFRNTLEKVISQDRLRGYPTGNEWMALCDLIKAVLAREKEMRK